MIRPARAVTFDFGQTLAELDTALLAKRLEERGEATDEATLQAAVPAAWAAYNDAVKRGGTGHPWKLLMTTLLREARVNEARLADLTDFLWDEQPKKNLWRRPIPGMIDLVRRLKARQIPLAVLSNSEGKLAELAEELGWRDLFLAIADSGKIGLEKPDVRIFEWTRAHLGVGMDEVVHIGDSVAADVVGALRAGMRAIWFLGDAGLLNDELSTARDAGRLALASDAKGVEHALGQFGLFD